MGGTYSTRQNELEIKIKEAEANKQIQIIEAEADTKIFEAKKQIQIIEAEADTKIFEANAKIFEANAKIRLINVAMSLSFAFPTLLAFDYFFRGTRIGRKLLVKSALFSTRFKYWKSVPLSSHFIRHVSREKVVNAMLSSSLPSMIIGPTGCGKSTLLSQLQRDFVMKSRGNFGISKPSVFISLRSIGNTEKANRLVSDIDGNKDKFNSTVLDGREALIRSAHKLCHAIGYPLRPPIVSQLFDRVKTIKVAETEVTLGPSYLLKEQICEALSILFESMAESRGLIIIDEVLDLLRDDRLKNSGGEKIFDHLTTLIVTYMVNFSQVKGAFAGSSNFLEQEFSKTVASDYRWHMEYLSDLPKDSMLDYLTAKDGFNLSQEIAEFILEKCGTRFRIIKDILETYSLEADIRKNINFLYSREKLRLDSFLQLANEYPSIPKLLSDVCDKSQPLSILPEKLQRQEVISKIFYVGPGSALTFQNKIIENLVKQANNVLSEPRS
jgi:DNA polymerase III delta prime subunit